MSAEKYSSSSKKGGSDKDKRLSEALKNNLRRRKQVINPDNKDLKK